jgi:glycerophosphoryl diester phosphodiesterase
MVGGMLVLAHRGANRRAPENTVAAMRLAVVLGADGVELDVHRSADGMLVVRHDADTPAGRLGDLTVRAILDACPEVPLLDAVLSACRGRLVNVEVKDPDPSAVDALLEILAARSSGPPDDVLVSSFELATIDRVRARAPHLPTGHLSFGLDPDSALALVHDHGHTAVHPDVWTLTNRDVTGFVTRAHDLGVQVNVWTVNDAAQLEQLRDAGVDAVITDDSDLYASGVGGSRGVRGSRP